MKDKTVAGILAILLGGLGVHKFYLGKTGQGILYLLFCWAFIPAIVGFIEGIMFLTSSQEAFDAKYNQGQVRPTNLSPADELTKLHQLLQQGAITQQEFDQKKDQLLR